MIESYFYKRMKLLGITPSINEVMLWHSEDGKNEDGSWKTGNVLKPVPIFRNHEKGIEIIVYTINRSQPKYVGEGKRWKDKWSIIRYEKPIIKPTGEVIKYLMPKGQGSYPFFPPSLLDKYDAKEKIKTLFLTEGFFKAFKGAMHGIDIVGLASITHMKSKETGGLHPDILTLIKTCGVEKIVWLTDGDCNDISSKALNPPKIVDKNGDIKEGSISDIDLYKRPSSFYASISMFKQLLDDFEGDKYFFHIDIDNILQNCNFMKSDNEKIGRDDVKGLDDLLCTFPDKIEDIVSDISSVAKSNGPYFQKFNISSGMSKVRDYFKLYDVNAFILYHQERNPSLKGKEFTWKGTKYKYNDEKGHCDTIIPADASLYFRVGDDYYKWVEVPNQYKQLERQFHTRSKTTITDDHGKKFLAHIPKFEAFCNVPDHINFQPIDNNCFNVYCRLDYQPAEEHCTLEDCPTIYNFLLHLFGEKLAGFKPPEGGDRKEYRMVDLALDYLQILYQRPQEKLPILCLVSKENNTGKSTFANFLRIMVGANVAIVGNSDIAGDFNAHWATKLVVVCDETKIDKQHVVEKIKSLSTARKIWMNAKGKGQVELDCFIKFVLITNNEDSFIFAGDEDIRYWVIKVPVLRTENPGILDQFVEEMPAFLSYLGNRKLVTERRNRMWFHPDLLKTDALKKVIAYSMPTIQKELRTFIRDMFFDFGMKEIRMSRKEIHKECFNGKYEANYLEDILKEKMKIEMHHKLNYEKLDMFGQPEKIPCTTRYSYPRWEYRNSEPGKAPERVRVDIVSNGRCYIFKIEQFLTPEEIATLNVSPENAMLNDENIPVIEEKAADLPF